MAPSVRVIGGACSSEHLPRRPGDVVFSWWGVNDAEAAALVDCVRAVAWCVGAVLVARVLRTVAALVVAPWTQARARRDRALVDLVDRLGDGPKGTGGRS